MVLKGKIENLIVNFCVVFVNYGRVALNNKSWSENYIKFTRLHGGNQKRIL